MQITVILYSRDPSRPPLPPHVMALLAMGLNLGSSGICLLRTQKLALNQCVHDHCLATPCGILRMFFLHAQIAVDAVTYATDDLI